MYPSTGLQTALNAMRECSVSEGKLYHQFVPVITDSTTIGEFGAPLLDASNTAVLNDFFSLLKKVVETAVNNKTFNNPLAELEGERMPLGNFIENTYVDVANPVGYDPNDFVGLLQKYESRLGVEYLSVSSDLQFKATITKEKIRNAFVSWANLEAFVQGIINSLYNGAYLTRYNQTKGLVLSALTSNHVQYETVSAITDAASAQALVEKMRADYTKMQIPSTKYNAWNKIKGDNQAMRAWSNPEDIVILISADADAKLSVRDLAYAFNISEADLLGRKIIVDDFTQYNPDGSVAVDGSGIIAMLADKSWFKIKTQDFAMDEFYNPNVRCWTYFLSDVRMCNYSFFGQGKVYCTSAQAPTIPATAVEAEKSSVTVTAGDDVKVACALTPANSTSTITAASSATGKATVAVSGKNVIISGKSAGSATITVTAEDGVTDTISVTVEAASE